MKLICIIKYASPYAPVLSITSKAGHRRIFVWAEQQKAHVWDRGELGEADSLDLEDLLGSRDEFYRPIVRILPSPVVHRPSPDPETAEAYLTAESVYSRDPMDFKDKNKNRVDDRLERKRK